MYMSDNAGFLYEEKVNRNLKRCGIQDKSFISAASDSNAPDGIIRYQGKDYKLEIKLDLKVDFGQGSLDYDINTKKWKLGGAQTPSAQAMRNFLLEIKVPDIVNRVWGPKGAPRKFSIPLNKFTQQDVEADYKRFTDTKIPVSKTAISKYYASKNTYYIQIGGHGLFYMTKDPAEFKCSKFEPETILRIRLKRGGSYPIYNYRFTTALIVPRLQKSNIDLDNSNDLQTIATRSKMR